MIQQNIDFFMMTQEPMSTVQSGWPLKTTKIMCWRFEMCCALVISLMKIVANCKLAEMSP